MSVRVIADEAVLLNVESGQYHGLDATGTMFWRAMEETATFSEAVEYLGAHFDIGRERISEELAAFCRSLEQRGLVEIESADS